MKTPKVQYIYLLDFLIGNLELPDPGSYHIKTD